MDYYSSSYYDSDLSEYHQTPLYYSSDFAQQQSFSAQSSYSHGDYDFYDQNSYYGTSETDFFTGTTTVGYSVSSFTEPKMYCAYDQAQTRFIVSYSVSEFNEPEFEDYDPTPYGGGYDPIETYGKPLPPSKETCYPHSSIDPNAVSSTNVPHELIDPTPAKPGIDESLAITQDGSKSISPSDSGSEDGDEEIGDLGVEHENRVPEIPGIEHENRVPEIAGVEHENRVTQVPYGYGLEAMDLCESLFGYWPCVAKAKRQYVCDYQQSGSGGGRNDEPWEGAADYVFGGSDPYGGRWDVGGSYQNVMYGYERHYQEQEECFCKEVEYDR